ncbi:hypothetical protein PG994_009996 [Apiospora phragmitis]|uniref:Uncharacterized protein n=1 Tax=Apiospora phragmitis TaxID=2905665 RepID=A0ABR1TNN2_9PEZI
MGIPPNGRRASSRYYRSRRSGRLSHLAELEASLHDTGLRPVIPSIDVAFLSCFSSLSNLQAFILAEDCRIEACVVMAYQVSESWMARCCTAHSQLSTDVAAPVEAMPPYPSCAAIADFLQGACVNCHAVGGAPCDCHPKALLPAIIQRELCTLLA